MARLQSIMPVHEVIDGREGSAYVDINGERFLIFQLKNFEASAKKNNIEIQRLGTTVVGNLPSGVKLTWKADLYYNTDIFRKLVMDYIKNGKETYFTIQVTNDDPNATSGRHTVIYRGCKIDEAILGKLDVEGRVLDESISGTYEDVDMPEMFDVLDGMRG